MLFWKLLSTDQYGINSKRRFLNALTFGWWEERIGAWSVVDNRWCMSIWHPCIFFKECYTSILLTMHGVELVIPIWLKLDLSLAPLLYLYVTAWEIWRNRITVLHVSDLLSWIYYLFRPIWVNVANKAVYLKV